MESKLDYPNGIKTHVVQRKRKSPFCPHSISLTFPNELGNKMVNNFAIMLLRVSEVPKGGRTHVS